MKDESRYLRRAGDTETHFVTCPLCLVGHAEVVGRRLGQSITFEAMNDPRKCTVCKRYFKLKHTVKIYGVPLENL
jgi:hypothetical protein